MPRRFPFLFQIAESVRSSSSAANALTAEERTAQRDIRAAAGPLDYGTGIMLPWYSAPADSEEGRKMRRSSARLERRDLTATGADGGSFLVGEEVPEIGSSLRDALVLERLGARVYGGLRSNVRFPRGRAQIAADWVSETGDADEASEEIASLNLSPHRVTAYLDVSIQLLAQGPASEAFLRAELMGALAEEAQRVAIAGKGAASEPLGIINTPGIGAVFAGGATSITTNPNGSAPAYEDFVNLEYAVTGTGKADRGHVGFVLSPLFRKKLRLTARVPGAGSDMVWPDSDPYSLLGHPAGVTTGAPDNLMKGVATNCSAAVCGEFSELILPIWGPGVMVDAASSRAFALAGMVRLVATAYLDSGVRYTAAFAAMQDARCA